MLKWHQKLISFWRPLGTRFLDQEALGVPSPSRFAAEDGVGPGLLGEDLGGGKPDVQTPRRVAVRNLALEGSGRFEEDLEPIISHAVPGWAAD